MTTFFLRTSAVFSAAFTGVLLLAVAFGQGLTRGAQIAYTSVGDNNVDIYLVDVERGISQNLTKSPETDMFPAWSPDGQEIAYRLNLTPGDFLGDIYLLDAAGGRRNLTNFEAYYDPPVWSPDGRQLAFVSNTDGDFEIYSVAADCADPCEVRALTANLFRDYGPAWAPDSSRLVVLSYLNNGRTELHIMDADGSNLHSLTENTLPSDQTAHWSPDDTHILFTGWDGLQYDIYMIDTACLDDPQDAARSCPSTLRNLTDDSLDDWSPVWSPDSSQIAFLSDRDGSTEIYTMEVVTGDVQRLSDNIGDDRDLAWSPDGQWLAYVSSRDGNLEVYVMRADGSDVRRLTQNLWPDLAPVWRPG